MTVPYAATRNDWLGLANAVDAELNSQFSVTNPTQLSNHRMYFLPPGVIPGIALGYAPGELTLYDDNWYVDILLTAIHSRNLINILPTTYYAHNPQDWRKRAHARDWA